MHFKVVSRMSGLTVDFDTLMAVLRALHLLTRARLQWFYDCAVGDRFSIDNITIVRVD